MAGVLKKYCFWRHDLFFWNCFNSSCPMQYLLSTVQTHRVYILRRCVRFAFFLVTAEYQKTCFSAEPHGMKATNNDIKVTEKHSTICESQKETRNTYICTQFPMENISIWGLQFHTVTVELLLQSCSKLI